MNNISTTNSFVKSSRLKLLGREVTTLADELKQAGKYSVAFDATGLPSGVYFYRLTAGDFVETKRMLLLK